jgi:hypothetical protein
VLDWNRPIAVGTNQTNPPFGSDDGADTSAHPNLQRAMQHLNRIRVLQSCFRDRMFVHVEIPFSLVE